MHLGPEPKTDKTNNILPQKGHDTPLHGKENAFCARNFCFFCTVSISIVHGTHWSLYPSPNKRLWAPCAHACNGHGKAFQGMFSSGHQKNDSANLRSNGQKHLPPIKDTQKKTQSASAGPKRAKFGVPANISVTRIFHNRKFTYSWPWFKTRLPPSETAHTKTRTYEGKMYWIFKNRVFALKKRWFQASKKRKQRPKNAENNLHHPFIGVRENRK